MADWVQPCAGGPRWRTREDQSIEVEGLGVPLAESTGYFADATFLPSIEADWGPLIDAAAAKHGVPRQWPRAIMVIESRGKNHPVNSAGAGGLMALMLPAASLGLGRQATAADVADPETAIDAGTGFIRYLADHFGWELPAIAAAYNAGSPKCSPTTRCKSTIDGAWTFDGTQAQNSMGFVEDCSQGRSSAYSLRATALNNTLVAQGIGGAPSFTAGLGNGVLFVTTAALAFLAYQNRRALLEAVGL